MCRIRLENQRFIEYLLQPHRHPLAHPPLSPPSSDMKGEGDNFSLCVFSVFDKSHFHPADISN